MPSSWPRWLPYSIHLLERKRNKMKSCILASLVAGACAFAPSGNGVRSASVATNAVWDDMYGGVDFRGKEFKYDPLNLAESYKPFLPWFREAEIKHGRTAMLAVMGFIATDFVRIPGDMYSFEAIPNTIDAHDALLKTGPMYQLLFWVGFMDILVTAPGVVATYEGEREPGGEFWDADANYMRTCIVSAYFCDMLHYSSPNVESKARGGMSMHEPRN